METRKVTCFKIWSHSVWSPKTLLGKEATLESCWAHGGLCISRKELCVESLSFQNTSTSVLCLVTQLCPTLCDPMDCSLLGLFVHRDFPGKYTGVGCHALLQGIFPTQESNPGLPYCRQILYYLSHQQRSPRILEWGSLSCFQGTFPTQESNQGLLLCRWILYHQTIHLYYYT